MMRWPANFPVEARKLRAEGRTYQHVANILKHRYSTEPISVWTVAWWCKRGDA